MSHWLTHGLKQSQTQALKHRISSIRHEALSFCQNVAYIWTFQVVQLVKNLPAMQKTPLWFLGQEVPPGKGISNLLQYSWASLVAQIVKNLPAMWETWAQTLGWEDLLGKGLVTHSSILAWRILMDRGAWWATVHGVAKNWTLLSDKAQHSSSLCFFIFLWVSFERFCQIF